jgi:hypothetical protein
MKGYYYIPEPCEVHGRFACPTCGSRFTDPQHASYYAEDLELNKRLDAFFDACGVIPKSKRAAEAIVELLRWLESEVPNHAHDQYAWKESDEE